MVPGVARLIMWRRQQPSVRKSDDTDDDYVSTASVLNLNFTQVDLSVE